MNSVTFQAFSDELLKTALLDKAVSGAGKAVAGAGQILRDSWHGPTNNFGWLGEGKVITPGMGRIAKAWQNVSSLGGLTRALPVGAKSMTLLGTLPMLPSALKKDDPTGLDRSRAERLSGVAGNVLGGTLAAGALMKTRLHPLASSIIGGIGGGYLGEKLTTLPFRAFHKQAPAQAQPNYASAAYAPGGQYEPGY